MKMFDQRGLACGSYILLLLAETQHGVFEGKYTVW